MSHNSPPSKMNVYTMVVVTLMRLSPSLNELVKIGAEGYKLTLSDILDETSEPAHKCLNAEIFLSSFGLQKSEGDSKIIYEIIQDFSDRSHQLTFASRANAMCTLLIAYEASL